MNNIDIIEFIFYFYINNIILTFILWKKQITTKQKKVILFEER